MSTILIVDDDVYIGDMLAEILTEEGYRTARAYSGTEALLLDRISEDTPDCTESSLKVHVSNLRRKLKAIDGNDYIEAVWGIGFKLNEEIR